MDNIGQLIKQISNILINDLNKKLKDYDITFSQLARIKISSRGTVYCPNCQK